ncbi:hypothetical protein B0I35DRAFT_402274 [Stachybotrys elegans]|uniref:BAH domain-containing protein n=1 Tax=Stachybotrys elegans TaxID=80388 RepID=A0A8K0SBZ4_9HYPO|nr:hypothetical protein B0I35DRAFT_402274 [Stachybotrys elegans]
MVYNAHNNRIRIAQILEIRAADGRELYALVAWMLSPDNLPENTICGKSFIEGRQSYHGNQELICSNQGGIVHLARLRSQICVKHLDELGGFRPEPHQWYWRQKFDCFTRELSHIKTVCTCNTPANPEKILIGCSNVECGEWMHYRCLFDDMLTRLGGEEINGKHLQDRIVNGDIRISGNVEQASMPLSDGSTLYGTNFSILDDMGSPAENYFVATLNLVSSPAHWRITYWNGIRIQTDTVPCLCLLCGQAIP